MGTLELKETLVAVEIEFTEPILGTCPKDPKVFADFIASKIVKNKGLDPDEARKLADEEVADAYGSIEATEERGWTTFMLQDDGSPFVYDYWIRGFAKSALRSLMENGAINKIPSYKSRVDQFVHLVERRLVFDMNGGKMDVLERPLRAQTAQGPRVAVVRSDCLPVGTSLAWTFRLLNNKHIDVDTLQNVMEWGELEGLGQWRSGGYGKFVVKKFEALKVKPKK